MDRTHHSWRAFFTWLLYVPDFGIYLPFLNVRYFFCLLLFGFSLDYDLMYYHDEIASRRGAEGGTRGKFG